MTTTPEKLPNTPAGPASSHYSSAYVLLENFVFNPTLVIGFLHRPATGEGSVPVTEVLYGGHTVTVEDAQQFLFHHLLRETKPTRPNTTI